MFILIIITVAVCLLQLQNVEGRSPWTFPGQDSDPIFSNFTAIGKTDPAEYGADHWLNKSATLLKAKLSNELNTNVAKNVIIFLGDGMSVTTLAAARIYAGQTEYHHGEDASLHFENFPYVGLSKTYCVDRQVADSACSATAYLNGVKANMATIGVTAAVKLNDCLAAKNASYQTKSILEWAQEAGKATGIVTTTRVTHASPSGNYAHISHRDMECDADILDTLELDPKQCNTDIAKQLVHDKPGSNIKVILGGGRLKFLPESVLDDESKKRGCRRDNMNLIDDWMSDKKFKNMSAEYVTDRTQLLNVNIDKTDALLGLFSASHMDYHLLSDKESQPTLAEMTRVAISILSKSPKGFYLFVEGGEIDLAHHKNEAHLALDETVQFAEAVRVASEMTSEKDTTIAVTADHAHVMTMAGYPERGADILSYYGKDKNNITYTTLSYSNGPGYRPELTPGQRHNVLQDDIKVADYQYPAMVLKGAESHGGEDVAVFASGPWSHLLAGNYEQSYIPYALAYAARIGPSSRKADEQTQSSARCNCGAATWTVVLSSVSVLVITFS